MNDDVETHETVGDGPLIVAFKAKMTDEQRATLKHRLELAMHRPVVVIDDDPAIFDIPSDKRMTSLDQRLQALEQALLSVAGKLEILVRHLDDEEEDAPQVDLEGNVAGKARAPGQPL